MFEKIYAAMWLVVAFLAGTIFLSGNFNMLTAVVFGLVTFGLVFMGMMCVLPSTVGYNSPIGEERALETPQFTQYARNVFERLRAFKSAMMSSNGVEVRKPKYP
jgi:hypothetical protein